MMNKTKGPTMLSSQGISRRSLLITAGVVGGGLVVGIPLMSGDEPPPPEMMSEHGGYIPNAFLQITPTNEIHFYQPRAEMGQGVYEGMTTLIAEELDVSPDTIIVHLAPVHPEFKRPGSPAQGTGGSTSMNAHYTHLRQVGANVREAIRQAAAAETGIAAASLIVSDGKVVGNNQEWTYGHFAEAAAKQPLPENAALKSPDEFRFIGTEHNRLDAWAKVTGEAQFGLDVDFPGLYRAVVKRCPVAGGTVKSVNTNAAASSPGVFKVVEIFNGVAVVAEHYWQARKAADLLEVEWYYPELANTSSAELRQQMENALEHDEGLEADKQGEGAAALSQSKQVIEATYWTPYLAHCTMEPMTCTVKIADGNCDVWVGCQVLEVAEGMAAHYSGVPRENVTIHSTFLGGGFGRRLIADYVAEATAIAKASDVPVQLVWSREDDVKHDRYRPVSLVKFSAGLDDNGKIETFVVRNVSPNTGAYFIDDSIEAAFQGTIPWSVGDWLSKRGYWLFENITVNGGVVEGLSGNYPCPNQEVRHATVDPGLPIGYWRAVGHSCNGFFAEGFMDELAHSAGQDPMQYRLENSTHSPRMQTVIKQLAEKSAWGNVAEGRYQGIAAHESFNTPTAQVIEISVDNQTVTIHKITCVVDCGLAVNPDIVRAQMESGIIYGLTAALYGEITLSNGAVEQSNFHDYPMLRMDQTPTIEVHIVDSQEHPTGVGEPGLPPVAPALANAIYTATGQRIRELPLNKAFKFS